MKLEAAKLRAEADAHSARMQSPLWAAEEGQRDEQWLARLTAEAPPAAPPPSHAASQGPVMHPQSAEWEAFLSAEDETPRLPSRARPAAPTLAVEEILPRLDALDQAVTKLGALVSHRAVGGTDAPGWLATAAGDPRTYDAPDAERTGVCVRVLPTTYAQLQQTQRRMGLRTTAGAWEFLLRLGLAAAERLPFH